MKSILMFPRSAFLSHDGENLILFSRDYLGFVWFEFNRATGAVRIKSWLSFVFQHQQKFLTTFFEASSEF